MPDEYRDNGDHGNPDVIPPLMPSPYSFPSSSSSSIRDGKRTTEENPQPSADDNETTNKNDNIGMKNASNSMKEDSRGRDMMEDNTEDQEDKYLKMMQDLEESTRSTIIDIQRAFPLAKEPSVQPPTHTPGDGGHEEQQQVDEEQEQTEKDQLPSLPPSSSTTMKDIESEYQAVLGPLSEALAAAGWDITKIPTNGEGRQEEDKDDEDEDDEDRFGRVGEGLNELNQNYENVYLIQARNAFQEEK